LTPPVPVMTRPRNGAPLVAEKAAAELAVGRAVMLLDDSGGRAGLVIAAELASPSSIAFMVRHTSGFLCASMTEANCDRLDLPLMVDGSAGVDPGSREGIAYAVSADVRAGTTTGISAHDRALTFNALADPRTRPADLTRPGHVVPVRACDGGVLQKAGFAEAAVDLCRLAGLASVAVCADLVTDGGAVPSLSDARVFAAQHAIVEVCVEDVVAHCRTVERSVRRTGEHVTRTPHGTFHVHTYESDGDRAPHLAMRLGDLGNGEDVLVRVHTECLAGDVFGSQSCDCGESLNRSLETISAAGRGVLVYLRAAGQPAFGVCQRSGGPAPTADRDSAIAADILTSEGVRSTRARFGARPGSAELSA
jgi:3,4-dihydroxy 2-butanone 4-phosphate synthase / GTP cyclohydrolase II